MESNERKKDYINSKESFLVDLALLLISLILIKIQQIFILNFFIWWLKKLIMINI